MPSVRLLARLLPLLLPAVGCGGSTSDNTSSVVPPGAAGAAAGGASAGGNSGAAGAAAGSGGAAGSAGGGSGAAGSAGGGGAASWACVDMPLLADADTGFFRCASGSIHRPEVKACPSKLPTSNTCGEVMGGGIPSGCQADTDCKDAPNGYCNQTSGGAGIFCSCAYGCTEDKDCLAGQICACGGSIGVCSVAACTKDADCGAGSACLGYLIVSGCGASSLGFACATAQDECQGDADCKASVSGLQRFCGHDGKKRTCVDEPPPCPGRPLLVAAVARLAGLRQAVWG